MNSKILKQMSIHIQQKKPLQVLRIKKCVQEIDTDIILKMFDNLLPKFFETEKNDLESL